MSELDLGTLRGHVDLDVTAFDRKYGQVTSLIKRLSSSPIPDLQVNLDTANVLSSVDKVAAYVDGLPDGEIVVDADTAAAAGDLASVGAEARGLPDGQIAVDADTSGAQAALGDVEEEAGRSGKRAGDGAGKGLAAGIVGALATIPVAGAVVLAGKAIGEALLSGLENEVRGDRLAAMTDLGPEQVAAVGRAAGEAYANNFGESIAANMDAARIAIQAGLLDPNATVRDTQAVIEQISGVADLLGEDVPRVARSAAQAIKTGIAVDAAGAFDLLVRAQKSGLNVSEDLLDTVDEYGTQFRKLGLEGPQAFGLIAQAVRAGARDTDIGADALKEFSIRAVDGSDLTVQSFQAIGLSASDMSTRIAAGGPEAAAALDETLDKLRQVEDPAKRAQIAVGLFGTQAEDLGDALYAMDLSTAVEQLGTVEGAAKSALDTLGDNAQGVIDSATRNVGVAADGLKGALAAAFSPQIEGFATFVTENREQVMSFLLGAANAALDFGRAGVEGAAVITEAFGGFVAGPLADVVDGLASMLNGLDNIPGVDTGDAEASMRSLADEMRGADEAAADAADTLRTNLITNGLDPAQQRLNDFAMPLVAQAALHDAMVSVASDLDGVGYAAGGAKLNLEGVDLANLTASDSGRALDEQLRAVVAGLDAQTLSGAAAQESQETLTARYNEGRDALINQLVQMGIGREKAEELAAAYGAVPGRVDTVLAAETADAQSKTNTLQSTLDQVGMSKPTAMVDVNTATAMQKLSQLRQTLREIPGWGGATAGVGTILAPGFAGGGYTGDGGVGEPAGIVHGKEFVVNAAATRRNRALLEAMNSGVAGYEGGGYVGGAMSVAPAQSSPAASAPAVTLDGFRLVGTLDLGDGLTGLIDARVDAGLAQQGRAAAGTRLTAGVVR